MANLIGHEGENSLLSFLKSENLALGVATDIDNWADCITLFSIQVKLTKNALENTDKVVEATYQYLQKIRDKGPQKYFFDELNDVGKMNFKYADKKESIDTVVDFARGMH